MFPVRKYKDTMKCLKHKFNMIAMVLVLEP